MEPSEPSEAASEAEAVGIDAAREAEAAGEAALEAARAAKVAD